MTPLPLHDDFSLGIERYDNRVRLIVYKASEEWVCRKEDFRKLEKFTETASDHIFRGRLRLHKDAEDIYVEVKGEIIGTIPVNQFKKRLTPQPPFRTIK